MPCFVASLDLCLCTWTSMIWKAFSSDQCFSTKSPNLIFLNANVGTWPRDKKKGNTKCFARTLGIDNFSWYWLLNWRNLYPVIHGHLRKFPIIFPNSARPRMHDAVMQVGQLNCRVFRSESGYMGFLQPGRKIKWRELRVQLFWCYAFLHGGWIIEV